MSSLRLGKHTSAVEVTNVSSHGIWLLSDGQELFLPYDQFPWFRTAAVKDVFDVQEPRPGHYYWPGLDVDLTRQSIEHPERYPLISK